MVTYKLAGWKMFNLKTCELTEK